MHLSAESADVVSPVSRERDPDSDRRRAWLRATFRTTQAMLSSPGGPPLDLALLRAVEAALADSAALTMRGRDGVVRIRALIGLETRQVGEVITSRGSLAGRVLETGEPILIADYPDEVAASCDTSTPVKSVMSVPLWSGDEVVGAVTVGRLDGRPSFQQNDLDQLATFAAQLSVALDAHAARSRRESTLLADTYARIASELQHSVVKDLFRIGIGMQGAIFDFPEQQRDRILGYVAEIDLVIERVRSTVYSAPPTVDG
jgi:GAF domain-containing protein